MSTIKEQLEILAFNKANIKNALIEMGQNVGDNMGEYADAIRSITTLSDALRVKLLSRTEYNDLTTKEDNILYLILNSDSDVVAMFIGESPLKFVSYESV